LPDFGIRDSIKEPSLQQQFCVSEISQGPRASIWYISCAPPILSFEARIAPSLQGARTSLI
jgi:hypothetical protein